MPVSAFRYVTFLDTFARRDDLAQPGSRFPRPHMLGVKPFNHLSVWAYLAIAFIIICVTLVLSYLLYSCYHSAQPQTRNARTGSDRRAGCSNGRAIDNSGASAAGTSGLVWDEGRSARVSDKVDEVGDQAKVSGAKIGEKMVQMKTFGFGFGHKRNQSESERKMIQRFHTNTSQNSLANVNEHSFELDNHYLSSAPLAHSTEGAATYIPFHLPPPPPSPTPAHKEFVERQKQHYRRRTQYQSPGSPSPSFYPDSPPPIMPNAVLSPSRSHTGTRSRSRTITFAGNGHPASEIDASGARGNNEPAVEFDSNNIRFVPPLNPFMTPSAVLLWNDPKLSPVHGSIITNASSTPTTPPDMSYFPSTSTTLVESLPATPIISSKKKPRLISSRPRLGSATSEGYGEKDNFTPIAQPVYGKENGGEERRNRI